MDAHTFMSKLDTSAGPDKCWPWIGGRNPGGYGHFTEARRSIAAHRRAWEIASGEIPRGQEVCHTCDNPSCCNPDHLFLGTHQQNMADAVAKGRRSGLNAARGEAAGPSKLRECEVREIRKAASAGESQTSIASRYGINQTSVSAILRRKSWAHIPDTFYLASE